MIASLSEESESECGDYILLGRCHLVVVGKDALQVVSCTGFVPVGKLNCNVANNAFKLGLVHGISFQMIP